MLYLEEFNHKGLNISMVNSYVINVTKHSLKIPDVIVQYNSQSSFMYLVDHVVSLSRIKHPY